MQFSFTKGITLSVLYLLKLFSYMNGFKNGKAFWKPGQGIGSVLKLLFMQQFYAFYIVLCTCYFKVHFSTLLFCYKCLFSCINCNFSLSDNGNFLVLVVLGCCFANLFWIPIIFLRPGCFSYNFQSSEDLTIVTWERQGMHHPVPSCPYMSHSKLIFVTSLTLFLVQINSLPRDYWCTVIST